MLKISVNVKIFKVKERDEDKNNKLMSLRINNEKLFKKYQAIWTKVTDLKNTELNPLAVYDTRYVKPKIGYKTQNRYIWW